MYVISSIWSVAHHPALFLIQPGTSCDPEDSDLSVEGITIMLSLIRYWIPRRYVESSNCWPAHNQARVLSQLGKIVTDRPDILQVVDDGKAEIEKLFGPLPQPVRHDHDGDGIPDH